MQRDAEIVILCRPDGQAAAEGRLNDWKPSPLHPYRDHHRRTIVVDGAVEQMSRNYGRVFDELSDITDARRELVVVVEDFDVSKASLSVHAGWSALVSMLILSVPEARWAFLEVRGNLNDPNIDARLAQRFDACRRLMESHFTLDHLNKPFGSQLFDGLGLRETVFQLERMAWILENASGDSDGFDDKRRAPEITIRKKEAALVMDDEQEFQIMLSLAAYSWGYRVFSVTSWLEAQTLLGPEGQCLGPENDLHKIVLSLEDWFVHFHDQTGHDDLHDLRERERRLPVLAQNHRRVFVSIGKEPRRREDGGGFYEENRKPTHDYYALWSEIRLRKARRPPSLSALDTPPMPLTDAEAKDGQDKPHGAQGRYIAISEAVLERARRRLSQDAIGLSAARAAVAASDVFRLLDGLSPMLAADALYQMHVAEVSVVASGIGARSQLNIGPRIKGMDKQLEWTSQRLVDGARKLFMRNAKAKIVAKVESILEANTLIADANECHRQARKLRSQLTQDAIKQTPGWIKWPRLVADVYVSFAFNGPKNFFIATSLTFTAILLSFVALMANEGGAGVKRAVAFAVISFVTVNMPDISGESVLVAVLCVFSSLLGLVHFGIFISILYSYWVERR